MAGDEPKIGPGLDLDDDMIPSRVRELVSRGLERYGAGDLEGAMSEWEHALVLDEDNAQAREYVEYVRNNIDVLDATFRAASRPGAMVELELPFGLEEVPSGESSLEDYESLEIAGGEELLDAGGRELAGLDDGGNDALDAGWTLDSIPVPPEKPEDSIELGEALDDIDAGLAASFGAEEEATQSPAANDEEALELTAEEPPAGEVVQIEAGLPDEEELESDEDPAAPLGDAGRDTVDLAAYGGGSGDFSFEEATREFPRPGSEEETTRRWPELEAGSGGVGAAAGWHELVERLRNELETQVAYGSGSTGEPAADLVAALVARALEEHRGGDPAVAVVALDLALQEAPRSAAAQRLLSERDDLIGEVYRRFLGAPGATLALAVPLHQLEMHALDHRAAFLISRIDSPLTVEDLLDVSGMSALEAYRHLSRLILQGILEVR